MIKIPAVIFSTPRTGSSALGHYLLRNNNITDAKYFNEPEYTDKMKNFVDYFHSNKNFIIKFHYGNLHKYPQELQDYFLSDNTFKISIRRRDLIKQIASSYIAICRDRKWLFWKDENHTYDNDIIPLDIEKLDYSIKTVNYFNDKLDQSNIKFDLEYYYEDLDLSVSDYVMTPQPQNYLEVIEFVKSRIGADGGI